MEDIRPYTLVSFRIFSPDLDPAIVTQLLGIEPSRSHLRGSFPRNNPNYSPYKYGTWGLDSGVSPDEPLVTHLEHLLTILLPVQDKLGVLKQTNTIDFFCSLHDQIGISLPASLMSKIAAISADLGMTFYAPDTEVLVADGFT